MINRLRIHLWTLPRWFAAPFFSASILLGSILAGGNWSDLSLWIGLVAGLFIMAGGHSWNSVLDYSWTGIDKGKVEDRSAEKSYSGAQNLLAKGLVSPREVVFNSLTWYILAVILLLWLSTQTSWAILVVGALGMLVSFWYSKAKFNWTHELALGCGVGPFAVLLGMYSVEANPNWLQGIIVSFPIAIVLSFAGLALDEWPDAEANLRKGVKSVAYKIREWEVDLGTYLMTWIALMYTYQVFLIATGMLSPMTGITFLLVFPFVALSAAVKRHFEKVAPWYVIVGAMYPILLVLGQAI